MNFWSRLSNFWNGDVPVIASTLAPQELAPEPEPESSYPPKNELAQAYALRVWARQSASMDRKWRIQRVKEALEAQGWNMEGIDLPQ